MNRPMRRLSLLFLVLILALAGCGDTSDEAQAPEPPDEPETGAEEPEEPAEPPEADPLRMAVLLSGPVSDGDFNAVQLAAINHVESQLGVEVVYSEEVGVADADRLARQYISEGFDIVALQAAAYLPTAIELANENPDVTVVTVTSGAPIPDHPENLWALGLDVTPSYYVLGYLAARLVGADGRVALIAGLEIPPLIGGANAMFAGARAAEPEVGVDYVFTGDFNDAVRARQAASELINRGAGVIAMHLNAAIPGAVQAIEEAGDVRWLAHFTDKSELSPDTFVAATVWDMNTVLETVVTRIQAGERGGETLPLREWISLSEVHNVDEDLVAEVQGVLDDVIAGRVDVPVKVDEVDVPE